MFKNSIDYNVQKFNSLNVPPKQAAKWLKASYGKYISLHNVT